MLRISRLADYATVLLAALAEQPDRVQTATALAEQTHIAAPTVSKLLKQLQRAKLVTSTRACMAGISSHGWPRRSARPRSLTPWTARWP